MKIRKKTNKNIYVSSEQVIDRSAWRCGGGLLNAELGETKLLNEQGNMCCLGHVCHNSGFGEDLLLNQFGPDGLIINQSDFLDIPGLTLDTFEGELFSDAAININDDGELSLKEREKQLKVLFKESGMNLTFKGKYPAVMVG